MNSLPSIQGKVEEILEQFGLEVHPFKVGWYNQHVKAGFELDYSADTLAFVVISCPSFFEKCFIPFVCDKNCTNPSSSSQDFLDQSITMCLQNVVLNFPENKITILHDYEMRPGTRRPRVLVQTAGHVSGSVYFYQKSDVENPEWQTNQSIYGVCLHPMYVGWFALRAVMVFEDILVKDLVYKPPRDILKDDAAKIELLNRYNFRWQDWSFRDIVEPVERYSDLQRKYFSTRPSERGAILEAIRNNTV